MNQIDLYRRVARILTGTAACPIRVALLQFGIDWRDEDTSSMSRVTGIVRCHKCLQWLESHSKCKVARP